MKRETTYSKTGKKLYVLRDKKGHFKDIQSFKRAHAADIKRTAQGEKRQRLIDYITAFYVMANGGSIAQFNKAWFKMVAKIDKLGIV